MQMLFSFFCSHPIYVDLVVSKLCYLSDLHHVHQIQIYPPHSMHVYMQGAGLFYHASSSMHHSRLDGQKRIPGSGGHIRKRAFGQSCIYN